MAAGLSETHSAEQTGDNNEHAATNYLAGTSSSCAMCMMAVAKYRCPACDRRTCSLACVNSHKARFECTGKRPRADYVAPLRSFTDQLVTRDFGFLEEVDAALDRADRDFRLLGSELKFHVGRRHRQRIELARACIAPGRGTRLVLAPSAMSIARFNGSYVVGREVGKGKGKGKDKDRGKGKGHKHKRSTSSAQFISWTVEWHFGRCGQVLVDRALPEHSGLRISITRFLENTWARGATKHLLPPYVEAGVDQLQVFLHRPACAARAFQEASFFRDADESSEEVEEEKEGEEEEESEEEDEENTDNRDQAGARKRKRCSSCLMCPFPTEEGYEKLDCSLSLRENLAGRVVVEYPVLHVALPQEVSRFVDKQNTARTSHESPAAEHGQ